MLRPAGILPAPGTSYDGAVLEIESQRGRGTRVVVTWSDQGEGDVDD